MFKKYLQYICVLLAGFWQNYISKGLGYTFYVRMPSELKVL